MFRHTIRTRYAETGQDGIIHHSSFVVYLEEARIEFLRGLGCHVGDLEKQHIFCPVVDLQVRYIKPLHLLEDIVIEVLVASYSKVRFTLDYQIFRGQECMAKASTEHCFVNGAFKPIAIPLDLMNVLATTSSSKRR